MSSIAALIAPQHHKPGPEKQRGLSATLTAHSHFIEALNLTSG
jgi:hypothetical protein